MMRLAPDEPPRILLISGSVREPSCTRSLTDHIDALLAAMSCDTVHWSLCERPLPVADPCFHDEPARHSDDVVRAFVREAAAADAFVLSTPIYHNSYSGVLKNALDHLAIAQFRYKPVGLISHGGQRSTQALDHLRIVVRGLCGVAIPAQVCTSLADYAEAGAAGYRLANVDILRRLARFTSELSAFARCLRALRQPQRESALLSSSAMT